jgi:hypothetical protein
MIDLPCEGAGNSTRLQFFGGPVFIIRTTVNVSRGDVRKSRLFFELYADHQDIYRPSNQITLVCNAPCSAQV